ncbi:hypothetical protein ACJEIK_01140 [Mycobacterium sp. SMC-16]|uniref:hypothetical protein n=1 Tax=unclassified Mycobacterium TaxID=2642494 RepID=UPI003877188D
MTDLPKPDGWKDRTLLFGFALVMVGSLGLFFAVKTVRAVQHMHWLAATICLAVVVVSLIAVVGTAWVLVGRVKLRASFDAAGTTLRSASAAKYLVAVLVALVVGGGLFLMFNSQVRDDLPSDARDRGKVTVLLVISLIGLGFMARTRGRPAPGLRLSADGVDYTDCYAPFTLAWDEISDITGLAPKGKTYYRPVVLELHGDRPPAVINNASAWAPDGVVLFWLIRHYWRYRQDRGELSNDVAIERLRDGRVTAEQT